MITKIKNLILTFLFSIFLVGNPTLEQIKIAKKYDEFIKSNIQIEVKNELSSLCSEKNWSGCIYVETGYIEILNMKSNLLFELAMIHEISHWLFPYKNEIQTKKASYSIIKYVNNLK